MERFWIATNKIGDNHNPAAVKQRTPHLPYAEIKRVRMKKRPYIALRKVEPGLRLCEQAQHIPVRDDNSFWLSGRTRCIDHVRGIIRKYMHVRIFHGLLLNMLPVS